ncbi:MAG TPA: hypothetical protein VL100_05250 [Croceibacterium sp.]|nr:hypothetical protein [Croceibacterium sp.]
MMVSARAAIAKPLPVEPAADPSQVWVERTVARYPRVTPDELRRLLAWFDAASALEVGLVASNAEPNSAYRAFRAQHLDRFTRWDAFRAAMFILFFGGGIAAIVALGTS